MANKKVKSFADELRSAAYIWLGNTNIDNTQLFLTNFNKKIHWIVVENNEDNITLKAPKETNALSQEIFTALYEIYPEWKKKETGRINTNALPKGLSITSDCNETFYKKGLKPLSATTVLPFLDSLGINITLYEYTKITVDNSHSVTKNTITKGYENYAKEAIDHMTDVSQYKSYTCEYPQIVEMVLDGLPIAMILAGPAGTGKSTEFKIACAQNEIPCYVTQFSANSQEDDFISSYIPNTTGEGGQFLLKRSDFTYAFEHGGIVILDEINFASPNVLSIFNSAIDDSACIFLDDGSIIHRHKDFRCIATLNPNYNGTNKLNPAFVDRFDFFYYPEIGKNSFISRLQTETGFKNKKALGVIYEQFDKLRNIYQTRNMETEVTYRRAKSFVTKMLAYPNVSLDTIFDMAFINNTVVLDLNDIPTELADLKEIRSEMISAIHDVMTEGTEEVTEASWTCQPRVDIDDLTSQIGDDGSFLDLDEEDTNA